MATRSISWHLGLLICFASAPLVLLGAGLLLWNAMAAQYAAESGLREAARALAAAVERDISGWTSLLYELAASPAFDCHSSDAFHSQATTMAARYGAWLVLAGPDGRQRMSTLQTPGPGWSFKANRPGVSDVVMNGPSGARAVFVAVPVSSENNAFCWLSFGIPAERFAGMINPEAVARSSWIGVLTDSTNTVIASSREPWPGPVGMQLAARRVAGGRWSLAVAAPEAQLDRAWLGPLAAGAIAALLTTILSLSAALAYAGRMKREVAALAQLAGHLGKAAPLPKPHATRVAEMALLAQSLARADEAVREQRTEHELYMAAEARRATAERADHSKDLFLATLSHELRSSLTTVIGWLDVARSSLDERRTLCKALDTAQRNASQQARIIDDLLDMSRILSGKFELRRHPVDLGRLALEAVEAWRPAAAAKRIELRARVHESAFVEGDRERLLQVMSNLLDNAIKFNRAGGWVDLTLEQADGQAGLIVADNGSGITQHALPHIFERFWQVPGSKRGAGLGLGLPLVQHIVELHDGRITVESGGPGKGARFAVMLPALTGRAEAIRSEAASASEEPALSLYGLGVVALDPDDDTLGWLQHLFARHGASTWIARSAEEAIGYFSRVHPDVLVSGMAISGNEAHRLIQAIHARRLDKPVAALAFSNEPTDDQRDGAFAAGYDGFVAKPCAPGVLVRAVRLAVERAGA